MTADINQCIIKFHIFTDANNAKIFDWHHINGKDTQAKEYLTTNFTNIDDVAIKALLSNEARPRATEHDGGIFLILKLINLTKNEEVMDVQSLRVWIEDNRVITVQNCELQVIEDMLKEADINDQYKTIESIISAFIEHMLISMNKALIFLDEKISRLERILITKKKPISNGIYKARQQLLLLEKYVVPQRDTIYFLLKNPQCLKTTSSLKNIYNQLNLYADDAEDIRKDLSLIIEENNAMMGSKLSNSVHTLAIISVALLPIHNLIHLLGSDFGEIWASLVMLFLIAIHIIRLKLKK